MSTEPHLIPTITDRGFKHLPEIPSTYPGGTIRTYESSAAMQPCIWVAAVAPENLNHPDGPQMSAPIHLTIENALRLADQIQFLARNHYQLVDPTPSTPEEPTPRAGIR